MYLKKKKNYKSPSVVPFQTNLFFPTPAPPNLAPARPPTSPALLRARRASAPAWQEPPESGVQLGSVEKIGCGFCNHQESNL